MVVEKEMKMEAMKVVYLVDRMAVYLVELRDIKMVD